GATLREVARYPSFTCYSLSGGSTDPCNNGKGCCSVAAGFAPLDPAAQRPIEVTSDASGDAFVLNQLGNTQPSLSRIAGNRFDCRDRNGNGTIDSSSDTNGDGVIQVDCNGDGKPDDIASVKGKPCSNGKPQEYY